MFTQDAFVYNIICYIWRKRSEPLSELFHVKHIKQQQFHLINHDNYAIISTTTALKTMDIH